MIPASNFNFKSNSVNKSSDNVVTSAYTQPNSVSNPNSFGYNPNFKLNLPQKIETKKVMNANQFQTSFLTSHNLNNGNNFNSNNLNPTNQSHQTNQTNKPYQPPQSTQPNKFAQTPPKPKMGRVEQVSYISVAPPPPPPNETAENSKTEFPPSLKEFASRAFMSCENETERTLMQQMLKHIISNATNTNSLWTTDWNTKEVPKLPTKRKAFVHSFTPTFSFF